MSSKTFSSPIKSSRPERSSTISGCAWIPDRTQRGAVPAGLVGQVFERAQPGRVDREHLAQAHDQHLRLALHAAQRVPELARGAEEEAPVHLEDLDAVRHVPARDRARVGGVLALAQDARDEAGLRQARDPVHEQEAGQHDADLERDDQVDRRR